MDVRELKYRICMSCGSRCCKRFDYKTWYVQLTLRDIVRIAEGLREPIDEVVRKYVKIINYGTYMILTLKAVDGKCIFLTDKGCSIQNFKPIACRTYPVYIPGTYIDPECPLSRYPELLEEEVKNVEQYIKEFNETRQILENKNPKTPQQIAELARHIQKEN